MPEASPLANGCLIKDINHASHELVIKCCSAHLDSCLLTFSNHVSCRAFNLLVPPVIKACDRENGERLPLDVVLMPLLRLRNSLPECKNIRLEPRGVLQSVDDKPRITHVFVPLVLETDHTKHAFCNGKGLSADFDTRNLSRLSFN